MNRLITAAILLASHLCLCGSVSAQNFSADRLTMCQWVKRGQQETLHGRVQLPPGVDDNNRLSGVVITMMGSDGKFRRSVTDVDGTFEMTNVPSGVYAASACGNHVFAAFAMHVVDSTSTTNKTSTHLVEIPLADIDCLDVNDAVNRYLPDNFNRRDLALLQDAHWNFRSELFESVGYRVARSGDGMVGHLFVAGVHEDDVIPVGATNVFLYRDGKEFKRTVTGPGGRFAIDSLSPGFYSLLAIGRDGIGSIGFELVDQPRTMFGDKTDGAVGTRFITAVQQPNDGGKPLSNDLELRIAPMPEAAYVVEDVVTDEYSEPPLMNGETLAPLGAEVPAAGGLSQGGALPGGGAGGFGGGGGGSFGGDALGMGLGAAGVAALGAAVGDDNNGLPVTAPPPASPSIP
ncbi:carboxypeptidase-like regulatory domain-containing protein [Rhodopirellula sallentina]|uniref:SD repeat-containing protein n=1 Tax=Rhodopirellula sallentina SM41 TaxID=1263870 RepID=M5UBR4_9BACT|nr:carboxypeptidase-like regulatory domain-containing protein [Rhodopirellula sallentina]EMI53448.1 SD repeat-containing protein [Rhodopirellula sallentina SM41]